MEAVLIIFMVLTGCLGILSVVVVVRDVLTERKKAAAADDTQAECAPALPAESAPEQAAPAVSADEEIAAAEAVPVEENAVTFSAEGPKTLDEKFEELSSRQQRYYVEITQYASMQTGARQFRNARYEEYKIGKIRLVRMQIKRGMVMCEFILLNSDFLNYIQDNKVRVRQSPTVLRVEDESSVTTAKRGIDIAVKAAAEEIENRKRRRREKRRLARLQNAAGGERGSGEAE